MEADDNSMELTLKTPTASCTNESTHIDDIPSSLLTRIKHFPYTIQTLLVDEALAVNTRIAKGKRSPGLKHPRCECDFFNKYLLPCRHILHTALFGELSSGKEPSFLNDADWMLFQGMLTKKEGLDVYRTRSSVSRNGHEFVKKTPDEGGKAEVDRLKMEELFERSKRLYQDLVDRSDQRGLDALVADLETLSSRQSI